MTFREFLKGLDIDSIFLGLLLGGMSVLLIFFFVLIVSGEEDYSYIETQASNTMCLNELQQCNLRNTELAGKLDTHIALFALRSEQVEDYKEFCFGRQAVQETNDDLAECRKQSHEQQTELDKVRVALEESQANALRLNTLVLGLSAKLKVTEDKATEAEAKSTRIVEAQEDYLQALKCANNPSLEECKYEYR